MLNEIARRLQFNYSIRIAKDNAYGKEDENGEWTGITGELTRRVNLLFSIIEEKFKLIFILDSRYRHRSVYNNIPTRTSYRFY